MIRAGIRPTPPAQCSHLRGAESRKLMTDRNLRAIGRQLAIACDSLILNNQ